MSFSSQIKEKLCKSEYGCMNCAAYELSGALMFGGNIGSDSIKFATENENIAKRITADINTAYGIQVETQVISKVQRIIIDNPLISLYIRLKISQAVYRNRTIYRFRVAEHRLCEVRFWAVALLQTLKKGIIWNLIRKAMSRHFVCRNCLKMRVLIQK